MSDSLMTHHDHFNQHVRRYLFVFYALIVGTVITVGGFLRCPFGSVALTIAWPCSSPASKAFWSPVISCT